jgi:hypothetical protein
VSQGRVPLSQPKVRKILDTTRCRNGQRERLGSFKIDHQIVLVGACRGRSPGFVPVFSVSRRFRHQPIGAALILFLKKHNNILSVYFSRLSSNCFPPYYIQPGRNILLLKIESSFQNQNKQKRLMSKLSCFARAASHLRPRRAKRHVHARAIQPVVCCSSIGRLGADAAPPSSVAKNLRRVT